MENEKYLVRVFILKFDENGNSNSEDFEYTFEEENPFDASNNAIKKTKDLKSLFEDEMPEESKFISPLEAELKGFKNINSYSLELIFKSDEDGFDNIMYGEDEEETIMSLQAEAVYYRDNVENQQYDEIEDENGEYVEILESDKDFFLNSNQFLALETNIMEKPKYIVRVNNFESYINGIRNSTSSEYIFEESTLIESRNKAIKQVKVLTSLYMRAISGENIFSSLDKTTKDRDKSFNSFQIDLIFSPRNGHEYQIFGEEDLMINNLKEEALYFKENIDSQPITKLIHEDGDEVEVLDSNVDFFINY